MYWKSWQNPLPKCEPFTNEACPERARVRVSDERIPGILTRPFISGTASGDDHGR